MKIIYPDNIVSVSADEENANYPVENVQTDYIKEVWKATSEDAELTLVVSSGKGAALFGCNAASAVVTVLTGVDGVWGGVGDGHIGASWKVAGDGHIGASWGESHYYSISVYDLLESGLGALWIDYDEITIQHSIEIDLTMAAGGIIEVGVAKAGDVKLFPNPSYGIMQGLHDYSIKHELSNGAWYIKKRDIIRTFDLRIMMNRDTYFYVFMHEIFLLQGSLPLAWRITDSAGFNWIVYARTLDMPRGSHDYPSHSIITISLLEVV